MTEQPAMVGPDALARAGGERKREAVERYLADEESAAYLADGLDEAIVGVARQHTKPSCVVYDLEQVIEIYARDMGREDAEEFVAFNVTDAWVGETTPLFLVRPWDDP